MTATMIKVELNAKLAAAIERCKKVHPKVRRIDSNTAQVTGSHGAHTVRIIQPREGLTLAECDCQAGRKTQLCYHVAAALALPGIPRPSAGAVLIKRQPKEVRVDGWSI